MSRRNLLMVADSEHDADMLHAVRMFVADPFIFARLSDRDHMVVSDLEVDRARREAAHCRVWPLSRFLRALRTDGVKRPTLADVVRLFLKQQGVKKVIVPEHFPSGLAARLKRLKVKLKVHEGSIFPARAVKCTEEIKRISGALTMAEVGLAEAIQALKSAKIGKNRRLFYRGAPLTSEKLRGIIDTAIVQAGGLPKHTIVAGGRQSCDPHETSFGPLCAHETIVIDVFPRSQKTGYFGDLTRTVVKGRASEALRRLYHTVARGQEIGFHLLMDKAVACDVHDGIQKFFRDEGYRTGRRRGRMEGFFHGTGHGVGLELHEAPRLSASSGDILRNGHVVALEPGLYYPGIGGVRLEDMALVTGKAARNLTKFEKVLEV